MVEYNVDADSSTSTATLCLQLARIAFCPHVEKQVISGVVSKALQCGVPEEAVGVCILILSKFPESVSVSWDKAELCKTVYKWLKYQLRHSAYCDTAAAVSCTLLKANRKENI